MRSLSLRQARKRRGNESLKLFFIKSFFAFKPDFGVAGKNDTAADESSGLEGVGQNGEERCDPADKIFPISS